MGECTIRILEYDRDGCRYCVRLHACRSSTAEKTLPYRIWNHDGGQIDRKIGLFRALGSVGLTLAAEEC